MAAVMTTNMIFKRAGELIDWTKGELIESFVFQNSKSIRNSTIILASFNVVAAFATAARILYDCYWASKRSSRTFKASRLFVLSIHPAETFPLILSIGIVIQGIVFAALQGIGLKTLRIEGCGTVAQFMWPALFIVPFIHAVFGLECAIRSLGPNSFRARGKFDVGICTGVTILMVLGTWVYSHIVREPDVCFACLIWYISSFGEETLIILSACAGIILLSTIVIFIRLSIVTLADKQERISASRIVYYNMLGLLSLGLIIPYFASFMVSDGNMNLSMMATVVLNLSGLMAGLLQIFLRSRTASISFEMKTWAREKQDGGISPCNDRAYNQQLKSPLPGQAAVADFDGWSQISDNMGNAEKGRVISMDSLESFPFKSPRLYDPISPRTGEPGQSSLSSMAQAITTSLPGSAKRAHARKQSYSLFPGSMASPANFTVPPMAQIEPISKFSTQNELTNVADELMLPPPIHFGHRRDSSVVSSATVQIGIRISQAPPESQAANVESTLYNTDALSPASTQSPKLIPISFSFRPGSPPAPLKPIKGLSPLRTLALANQPSTVLASSNKTLPAIPKTPISPPPPKLRTDSTMQLSPVAYSPTKKTAAPSASSPKTPPGSSSSSSPRSAVTPALSPKRAPLPSSPRPAASPRSDTSQEGWI